MTTTDPLTTTTDPVQAAQRAAVAAEPEFGRYFLIHFLGLSIAYDDDEQTCTVTLPFAPHLCNAGGATHGGVLSTALDISMGHTCQRYLSAGSTIQMEMRFLRPISTDAVCTGRHPASGPAHRCARVAHGRRPRTTRRRRFRFVVPTRRHLNPPTTQRGEHHATENHIAAVATVAAVACIGVRVRQHRRRLRRQLSVRGHGLDRRVRTGRRQRPDVPHARPDHPGREALSRKHRRREP